VRPLRIRVEGFSAFRSPVEVNFEGVDFFSLSGHTGSGKSSLIDAMVFALYGRVPRLGGNAVAPAISAGVDRARVAFDFEVDDVAYTAVRLAERTKSGGAGVKEARLQQGDNVVADGADDVSAEVGQLLKLGYDEFARTVVLPQGEFARFLTSKKAERQTLLRSLLGLDVYTTVRKLARIRGVVAAERVDSAVRWLETMTIPTDAEIAVAVRRHDVLVDLSEHIVDIETQLFTLVEATNSAGAEVTKLDDSIARLTSVRAPQRLTDLAELANEARGAIGVAEESLATSSEQIDLLTGRLGKLPTVEAIAAHRGDHELAKDLDSRLANEDPKPLLRETEDAQTLHDGVVGDLDLIRKTLTSTRLAHSAHALSTALEIGEKCPVCDTVVEAVPNRESPEQLASLEAVERESVATLETSKGRLEGAKQSLTAITARRGELMSRREKLSEKMLETPSLAELAEYEATRSQLGDLLSERNLAHEDLVRDLKQRHKDLDELSDQVRGIDRELTTAQLLVADLDPPVSESDDLLVKWRELLSWVDETKADLISDRARAVDSVETAMVAADLERRQVERSLTDAGVPVVEPFSAQVARELEIARQLVASQAKIQSQAAEQEKNRVVSTQSAEVAHTLAGHLRANGFEQWLMVGALADLVSGANGLLAQLSNGGYSLHSDEVGSFSIIDHRNADEMRSVATLSGGETFLVSLALALSLAETLAAAGGAGLDAIILDEGFGTLDDESLDTVASVLEELVGKGLMVGVITHVKELASRAPVRFEVSGHPGGAKVAMVS
jgi:exonuclease SbcC